MSVPDFLLDEHITPVIQGQLAAREPGIRVLVIGQLGVPPKGTLIPNCCAG